MENNPTNEIKNGSTFKNYLVTIIVGIVITFLVLLAKDIFSLKGKTELLHAFTDAFFVSGFLIFGFGLLIYASNEGTFDMISYGFSKFLNAFKRDMTKFKYKTFYDYRKAKQDKKLSFSYMIFVGLGFLAISLIFLYFYNN